MSTIDEYLTHATIAQAPDPDPEPVDRRPVITDAIKHDNLRRLKYPCLVTESYDTQGNRLREYRHDPGVQRDVLISTVGADRGEGSRDSIKMLREETANVAVEGFLPREEKSSEPTRDAAGRFSSKDER